MVSRLLRFIKSACLGDRLRRHWPYAICISKGLEPLLPTNVRVVFDASSNPGGLQTTSLREPWTYSIAAIAYFIYADAIVPDR